jgi:hypothetical protein
MLVVQLEHQARPDPDMPRRMLEMAVARMPRGRRLPLPSVVSVVFYQGPERWTGPRSLSEQRGHAEPTPGMVHLEPVFIDLGRLPPERLPSGEDEAALGLRCALELLSVARRPDLWGEVARRAQLLGRLREGPAMEHLIGYIHRVARTGPSPEQLAIIDGALAEEGLNMGAWMQRIIRESEDRGRQEGAAGMLRRSLQIRFGPLSAAHEDRLQQLTADEAEALIGRVFSAGRIDEVFAG